MKSYSVNVRNNSQEKRYLTKLEVIPLNKKFLCATINTGVHYHFKNSEQTLADCRIGVRFSS